MNTATITKQARSERGQSLRAFADAISVGAVTFSHATISNWESGTRPERAPLVLLSLLANGWQADYARRMLAAMEAERRQAAADRAN